MLSCEVASGSCWRAERGPQAWPCPGLSRQSRSDVAPAPPSPALPLAALGLPSPPPTSWLQRFLPQIWECAEGSVATQWGRQA